MSEIEKIIPLIMPKWGLSMTKGALVAWHVEEGASVKPGQEIMDIETDKIANAVEAGAGGVLRRRLGEVGKTYPVKALLGVLASEQVSDDEIDAFVAAYRIPANQDDEAEQEPDFLFLDAPVGRLRYAKRPGTGNPILFIHGFGGDLNNWLFNIDAVAAAGPAYALDLPGHGGSIKIVAQPGLAALGDAVEQFMNALKLKDAILVGHSLGGAVAATVALRAKGLVKALTLISPAGLGPEINTAFIDAFVAAQSRRDLTPVVQLLFADPTLASRRMIDDLLKFKRLDGVSDSLRGLATALFYNGRQKTTLADDLATLSAPLQLIWGAQDAIIPVKHTTALPNATVEIIENAGHVAQMEAAGRVNELIRAQAARLG